jgi:hypothetical protein
VKNPLRNEKEKGKRQMTNDKEKNEKVLKMLKEGPNPPEVLNQFAF